MSLDDIARLAFEFSNNLKEGRFENAHEQLTQANKLVWSANTLQQQYEDMISYGEGPAEDINVELTDTMEDWLQEKREDDIGWVYVSIVGELFSEAVALIYTNEGGVPKIRTIEWGRP